MIPRASALVLAFVLASGRAYAQDSGPYLEVALGATRLESPGPSFGASVATVPALALGYDLASGLFVEGRVSTLRGETTESSPAAGTDAPYTLELRVVLVDVRAGMRPEMLRLGPLQPVASVGGVWARLTDTWTSDTPTERHRGATLGLGATLGVETTLTRQATLAVSGSYRALRRVDERPVRALGLPGMTWTLGLRLRR